MHQTVQNGHISPKLLKIKSLKWGGEVVRFHFKSMNSEQLYKSLYLQPYNMTKLASFTRLMHCCYNKNRSACIDKKIESMLKLTTTASTNIQTEVLKLFDAGMMFYFIVFWLCTLPHYSLPAAFSFFDPAFLQ